MIKNLLIVAAGGAIGSMLRYLVYLVMTNQPLPYATLLVNIIGSFVIGALIALSLRPNGVTEPYRLFLATGICGGFTTFSAFSLENVQLLQAGKINLAFLYMVGSVVLGLAATWLGFKLVNA